MTSKSFRVRKETRRSARVTFLFDGRRLSAYQGETLAAALLAHGIRAFRRDSRGTPRGPYCNMGTCFECLVEVCAPRDPNTSEAGTAGDWSIVRACMSLAAAELTVRPLEQLAVADDVT